MKMLENREKFTEYIITLRHRVPKILGGAEATVMHRN
jgi:hypothetical protein